MSVLSTPAADAADSANVMMSIVPDRRRTFRTDLEERDVTVESWDAAREVSTPLGTIVNLSTDGLRFKTRQSGLAAGQRISMRMKLPTACGIRPFIDQSGDGQAGDVWAGQFEIIRVSKRLDGAFDVAGRLMNMSQADRGMLGLYLSLQAMAA